MIAISGLHLWRVCSGMAIFLRFIGCCQLLFIIFDLLQKERILQYPQFDNLVFGTNR